MTQSRCEYSQVYTELYFFRYLNIFHKPGSLYDLVQSKVFVEVSIANVVSNTTIKKPRILGEDEEDDNDNDWRDERDLSHKT